MCSDRLCAVDCSMEATEDREPQGIRLTSRCLIQISPSLVQLAIGVLLIAFILHSSLWIGFKVVLFCLHNVFKLSVSVYEPFQFVYFRSLVSSGSIAPTSLNNNSLSTG